MRSGVAARGRGREWERYRNEGKGTDDTT